MIQLSDIHFTYPNGPEVIRGLSCQLQPHEILGILGPNGSGKTTLINLMLGLLKPNAGTVTLSGQALSEMSPRTIAQQIAHVPQIDGIELNFSVWDIVMMGRQAYQPLFGFDSQEDREHVESALHATEIETLKTRSIQELSGGERRRVLIARALAQNTPLLLLDEPTAHLDIHYQLEICELLLKLRSERERAIVMSLHDINLASLYCDKLLLLSEGKIHAMGPPEQVITKETIKSVFGVTVAIEQDTHNGRPYYRLVRDSS